MKKLFLLIAFVAFFASCSSYYQIATVSSDSVTMHNNGEFSYTDNAIKVVYSFWSENGYVSFTVTNNTDKDIVLDMSQSFFINNGFAYDYYLNRVDIYTEGSTISKRKMAASASSAAAEGAVSSSKSHSVECPEADNVVIPAHSSKVFGEYSISSSVYRTCGLARDPRNNNRAAVNFTLKNSPYVVENRLMFVIDGQNYPVEHTFFVSEIANYSEASVLEHVDNVDSCGNRSNSQSLVRFNKYASSNRYYHQYKISGREDMDHGAKKKNKVGLLTL